MRFRELLLKAYANVRKDSLNDGMTMAQFEFVAPASLVDVMNDQLSYAKNLNDEFILLLACAFIRGYIYCLEKSTRVLREELSETEASIYIAGMTSS